MNFLMNIDICKLQSRRIFSSSYCQLLCMSKFIHLGTQQIFNEHLLHAGTMLSESSMSNEEDTKID